MIRDVEGIFLPFFAGRRLLAYTELASPSCRIVSIDPARPDSQNWVDIVPECERRIQQFAIVGDKIFVTRTDRFSTKIESFALDGRRGEDVSVPLHGSVALSHQTTSADTGLPGTVESEECEIRTCVLDSPDEKWQLSPGAELLIQFGDDGYICLNEFMIMFSRDLGVASCMHSLETRARYEKLLRRQR